MIADTDCIGKVKDCVLAAVKLQHDRTVLRHSCVTNVYITDLQLPVDSLSVFMHCRLKQLEIVAIPYVVKALIMVTYWEVAIHSATHMQDQPISNWA